MNSVDCESPEGAQAKTDARQQRAPEERWRAGIDGVLTGTLVGFKDELETPLVLYRGQPGTAAIAAATTIDLKRTHIGRQVALAFEAGNPRRPMIIGVLRDVESWPLLEQPGVVEVDADGARLLIEARQELVLRCGKASITLTRDGKVLVNGTYVSTRSQGVLRVAGASVEIN